MTVCVENGSVCLNLNPQHVLLFVINKNKSSSSSSPFTRWAFVTNVTFLITSFTAVFLYLDLYDVTQRLC